MAEVAQLSVIAIAAATVAGIPPAAAATFNGPACRAIAGIAGAATDPGLGTPRRARRTGCAAAGAERCRFRAGPERA